MRRFAQIKRTALTGLLALILGVVTTPPVSASALALSDVPLLIDLGAEPNVVVSLDDSSSMKRCLLPDTIKDDVNIEDKLGMTAYAVNELYYNPNITYLVPLDENGVSLGIPDFDDAWINGYNRGEGTVELDDDFRPCWDAYKDFRSNPLSAQDAYYHEFSGNPNSSADLNDSSKFTKVRINSSAARRNFAIWFSYYRSRLMAMKAAAGLAFSDPALDGNIRIAYQGLWGLGGLKAARTDIGLMKKFEGQARTDFFNWLYTKPFAGGTALRYALHKVGLYFSNKRIDSTTGTSPIVNIFDPKDSPWAFEPGVTKDPELTCRQAFHVMLSDGNWNNDAGISGNVDGTSATYPEPLPSGATTYTPFAPYDDGNSTYLADTAFHYWITDLRLDMANDVPAYMLDQTPHPVTGRLEDNPKNDPATWQHLVNFMVNFGVDGQLAFNDTTYNNLLAGSTAWTSNQIDDMWHAGINSRGAYVSAEDPQQLTSAFTAALNAVIARTGSGASVALNSGSLDSNSRLYQGRFNSGTWSGQLLAFDINQSDGSVASTESWDAGALLTTRVAGSGWNTNREVITFDGTQGIPFLWASLNSAMQIDLDTNSTGVNDGQGQARLKYLRGSAADEGINGNKYRARSTKLGDIIDSSPVFVGAPAFNYPDGLESQAYAGFASSNSGRPKMVYVGANDGMLHGFDASTGEEKIAYVPKKVFPNLSRLGDANYAHRFFVNGSPTAGDAFVSGAWRTVLVGGMRKGGQAIYALDVTDPTSFDESNASSLVLWEFTDADDSDLGYTYARPAIVRMNNGKWAAVFGNGYNNTAADGNASTTGNAVLFIVDI
ncbi:MAG: PilC/PilY family type IV pilus protein, partial [Acidiferrobacterales bacterium]